VDRRRELRAAAVATEGPIQKLLADYDHLVDAGDGETWADLFVDDGTLDTGMRNVVEGGRDALAEFANAVPMLSPGCRHMVTNASIDGDGTDARVACYFQMWGTDADPAQTRPVISGIYRDVRRKDDDGWRFVSRALKPDTDGPNSP
jgi:hypothetical protein